ncbi:MAG: superoxide dismutase, partial [Spirochaetota bacterium]|nr:superoxide dismutase [Spirochaetota bacterium]
MSKYTEKKWNLSNLKGFSSEQIDQHFKLYAGYVANSNTLDDKLTSLIKENKHGTPEYNELKRRFGWEFNGMRLHEYYFDNLGVGEKLDPNSALAKKINENFGSYENWLLDFKKTGAIRGIGWAILYKDNITGHLHNVWIGDHHIGHEAGSSPILVMDVWEHA